MAAADFIGQQINTCVRQKDCCHIALPGGNTPVQCFAFLIEKDLDWGKIYWYLGDERCYPVGHKERNDVMLQKNLWSRLPQVNAFPIPAELGAEEGARHYRKVIDAIELDIIFLGMGEDGHTASLFPGNQALQDERSVVPVYDSPKPPPERVSLGLNTLQSSPCRVVLASGSAKAEVMSRIRKNEALPINCIGDINWFIDKAAAGSDSF